MKKYLLLLLPLLTILLGCSDDKNTPDSPEKPDNEMDISIVSIQDAENMFTQYASPDPGCGIPKMLEVVVWRGANEVVIECGNYEFTSMSLERNSADPEEIGLTATITSPKIITLSFDELPDEDKTGNVYMKVSGKNDERSSDVTFMIHRAFFDRLY